MKRLYEPVRAEWERQARSVIPAYLFYETWREWDGLDLPLTTQNSVKGRRGTCSSCGAVFCWTRKDAHMKIRHGDTWTCPDCGAKCEAIASGKMPERKKLAGDLRAVFCDGERDLVRLHCFYIWYHYGYEENEPTLEWYEDARYELEPGAFRIWKYESIAGRTGGMYDMGFVLHKNPIEPWAGGNYGERRGYVIFLDGLEGTFLGHLPIEEIAEWRFYSKASGYPREYVRTPWCKLLSVAAKLPKIEILAKRGITEPVIELVTDKRKNARYLNWNAKKPADFLRIPKADAAEALSRGFTMEALKICRDIGLRIHEAERIASRYITAHELIEWKQKTGDDPKEAARYIDAQHLGSNGLQILQDYREAAEVLGRDLSVPSIRWPKDLVKAHDDATKSAQRIKEEARKREREAAIAGYAKGLYPLLRARYEYQDGELMAIVPERLQDIALEGKNQHHCVGGYIDRHAAGKLTIMFIRRVTAPMIPLWTVELTPEGIMTQIQGYHNEQDRKPKGTDAEWVDGWLREIKKRIRKEKRHG